MALLPKPDACKGCPLYGDGLGFVPDELVEGAQVMVVGQNPGEDEERGRKLLQINPYTYEPHPQAPFIGKTGYHLCNDYLPRAGLERGKNVSLGNVLRCRLKVGGKRVNDVPSGDTLQHAIAHCTRAHLRIPESTRLIVAQGAHAWAALGGPKSIREWRGYLSPDAPLNTTRQPRVNLRRPEVLVYGTVHVADTFHEPDLVFPTKQDFAKIPRLLSGEWPREHPKSHCHGEYNAEVQDWIEQATTRAPWVVVDGEWPTGSLSLLGFGYPGSSILQLSGQAISGSRGSLERLFAQKRMVYWNAKADVHKLAESLGLGWESHRLGWDDPMLLHSTLWTELDHDLEFVASIYSDYNKRKHLKYSHPLLYNAGDVADTVACAVALFSELDRTPRCRVRYEDRLAIIPHLDEAESKGIAVHPEMVDEKIAVVRARVAVARGLAQASVGYPVNVGSADQVRYELYDIQGHTPKKKKKTKAPTVDNDAIAGLRTLYLPFDPLWEEKHGVTEGYILDRIAEGADPLLEARALFSANDYVDTHYLSKLLGVGRVHHNIEQHTQDNFRWSYTNPPLATFEEELRAIFIPDPGWPWLGWDKEGIELRLIACEARSDYLIQALLEGWDLHTLTACDIWFLPYPPVLIDPVHDLRCADWRREVGWKECSDDHKTCGKSDPRRAFGKNFRYRRNYGGKPEFAMDIPGAVQLGLNADRLRAAARQMDIRDPQTAEWWRRMDADVARTRCVWDWRGSLRRLHTQNIERRQRQAYDFPMQAGTQSIMDVEFLQIKREFKDAVYFVYGAHDSNIWGIDERYVGEIEPRMVEIANSSHEINGVLMPFPASMKPLRYA